MYARIQDHEGLVRDMDTQAILPIDLSIPRKHEARVLALMKEEERNKEIDSIKTDVLEIKEMLKNLCNVKGSN